MMIMKVWVVKIKKSYRCCYLTQKSLSTFKLNSSFRQSGFFFYLTNSKLFWLVLSHKNIYLNFKMVVSITPKIYYKIDFI